VGPVEARALVRAEGTVKYHPGLHDVLTTLSKPEVGPWQVGSLTGAVASERVTEAREGWLSAVGTRAYRV
jgi:Family of unknown function (DUF6467)